MGASEAGLTVCHEARLAAVVMAGPRLRLRPYGEQLAVRPRIRGIAKRSRDLRGDESDGDEFDHDPASHRQGENIIDRGNP